MAQESHSWKDCLVYASISDVGMRRANNQDSLTVVLADDMDSWQERGHLFMVADGMGAHAAGELASQLAVENVAHNYLKFRDLATSQRLERAIQETNSLVHKRGQANAEFHAMGTTSSTLLLTSQGAWIGHVGDSRVYRLRGDKLEQLTFDHSLVWEMQALGQLSEKAELARVPKNVITRSLGPNASLQVDIEGPFPIEVGDTFLLCSDGLTGPVTDEEIGPLLANLEPGEAGQVLVDLANLRGGPDNITVVIAKVTGEAIAGAAASTNAVRRKPSNEPSIHPLVWVVLGVCLLVALVLLLADNYIAAFVAALVGIVAVLIGVAKRFQSNTEATPPSKPATSHGKSPYRVIPCSAGAPFLAMLREMVEQLREAALERDWEVDYARLDQFLEQADRSAEQRRNAEAVQHHASAVRFMMQELRNQNRRRASDSTIDY